MWNRVEGDYSGHLQEALVSAEVDAGDDSLVRRHNDPAAQAPRGICGLWCCASGSPFRAVARA
jgi:hypothetical protein